jgi:hypothetical protein
MTKNVIELNGQKYDASTGKMLGTVSVATKPKAAANGPKHLDGFTRRPGASRRTSPAAATSKVHQQPQKSKTLMRTAVKKPVAPAKIHSKAPATSPVAGKHQAPAKTLLETVRPGRVIRANHTPQSSFISKFGQAAAAIKTEALAVKPAPASATKPAKSIAKAPAPAIVNHPAQTVVQADPFQSAIDHAVSHEQPKAKKTKVHHRIAKKLHVSPRIVSFASVTLMALAVSGLIAYQNLPELAMRVAATRAGLHANLPSYQPSGFSMSGPIQYQPGEVTLNYKSNSDERGFNVVQKNSSWNSETLLENYVTTTNKPFQTFQANGRTIYIYDGNKATWVDGGIWYNIDGKSNLNSDQLLRIAGSL